VAHACFEHFALVFVADAARIDAWFRLSFGLQQIYALLPLDDRDMSPPTIPSGITIRRAGPDDSSVTMVRVAPRSNVPVSITSAIKPPRQRSIWCS
jgi:hypothetical protein